MSEKRLVESVNRIIILLRKKSTYLALFHPAQVYQAISMELYWGRFGLSHFLVDIPLCAPKIGFQNTKWAPLEGDALYCFDNWSGLTGLTFLSIVCEKKSRTWFVEPVLAFALV